MCCITPRGPFLFRRDPRNPGLLSAAPGGCRPSRRAPSRAIGAPSRAASAPFRRSRGAPRDLARRDGAAREQLADRRLVGGGLAGHRVQVLDRQMAVEDQDLCHGRHGDLLVRGLPSTGSGTSADRAVTGRDPEAAKRCHRIPAGRAGDSPAYRCPAQGCHARGGQTRAGRLSGGAGLRGGWRGR